MTASAKLPKWFAPIIAFAILMVCSLWFFNEYIARVSIPRREKLADFTNGVVNIHLMVPQGHGFRFDLNTPGTHSTPNGGVNSSYKFSGHIRIASDSSLITDFAIGSDKAWLTASDFVLTGIGLQNTNTPPLSQFIQAQKDYDIQITLNPPPPPATSIWLYWLQSRRDTKK